MSKRDFASNELPKKRLGRSLYDRLYSAKLYQIVLCGIVAYVVPVFLVTIIEHKSPKNLVVDANESRVDGKDLLYFNFITILTVGYGEFHPVEEGRWYSILLALYGVGCFGLILSILTAHLFLPLKDPIRFSRYAYYCTDQEMVLLVFVNTTDSILVNADMSSYFKIGGDWSVRSPIRAPFVTRSVQTFFIEKLDKDLIKRKLTAEDMFRFGISGILGLSPYSAGIEYSVSNILVLKNRDALTSEEAFIEPDFKRDISDKFHYRPAGAVTLLEWAESRRKTV